MRRHGGLLLLALATFVTLGLADGALGVAWPSMRRELGRSVSELGVLLASLSIGYLSASTGFGRVHRFLGTGVALGAGCTLMTLGFAGFALAPLWALVVVSAALFGVGGGLVDAGVNAHAALEFDVGSVNLLHASYGVGATLGPVVITTSLAAGAAWRGGYAFIAVSQALVAVVVWMHRDRWVAATGADTPEPQVSPRTRVSILLLLFLLYTGVEVAAGQWAFTLLTEGRGSSASVAGFWTAAYWGGLTAGRFLSAWVGSRIDPSRILDGSMVVALAGIGLLWWDPGGIGAVGLPVAGIGFSAVFPTMVSLTPARIGRVNSTRVIGFQLAAANVGAATVPWILGVLAEQAGLGALTPGLMAFVVALAVVHLLVDRGFRIRRPFS